MSGTGGTAGAEILSARYTDPTDRYDHGVLGDSLEWGGLELSLSDGQRLRAKLPETLVFEDNAPRLVDLDGDGAPEVLVVESSLTRGARLAVWDTRGRIAATPFLGQRHRWLAPLGAADLDGDGRVEIAYVDRPHLARVLRVWRLLEGRLVPVADLTGVTNHRIGWPFILGGFRDCAGTTEIVAASGDWNAVLAIRLSGGELVARVVAPYRDPASVEAVLACR